MSSFPDKIIKYRWLIIIFFIVITILSGSQLPKAKVDSDIKSMLPKDMPSRVHTDRIEELFGGTDMIMILIETDDVLNPQTLKRIRSISKQVKRVKGLDKIFSLFELKSIISEDGAMVVNPAVTQIPRNKEEREELRKDLIENDIVYGLVISKDFKMSAIIGMIGTGSKDEKIIDDINKIIKEYPGKERISLSGLPITRVSVAKDIQGDISHLMPFGLLVMLIFLYLCFKQLRGVVLPFVVVVMAIIFSMGMIPTFGWKVQIISVLLPVILIAVANDYGIHIIAKFQEFNYRGNTFTRKEIAKKLFTTLGIPVLMTGVTTIVGLMSLMSHVIVPAKQLAILSSIGILFALAASLFFIPAVLSLLPLPKSVIRVENENHRMPILERVLTSFGNFVSSKPRKVITISIIIAIIASFGSIFVVVDADPNNYYSKDNPIVRTSHLIDKHFGGSKNISIAFEGDIKSPDIMNKIEQTEEAIIKLDNIGQTTSIARVVRQMSRALNDKNDKYYNKIPNSRNAIAQYFELYSMSGDPDDFSKLVDFPYRHAQLIARINTSSTPKITKTVNEINDLVKNDKNIKEIGGFAVIFAQLAELVVYGQIYSLFIAAFLVAFLLMFTYRSLVAGFISAIPLAVGIGVLFGIMGYAGIELNIATAMLSSIMIGVGVDYTIHFLWRYKEELANGLEHHEAIKKTLITTGRGIVFNALSVVVGFIALLISSFKPVQYFGLLVIITILSCLLGALLLIPALILIIKPKFLEPKAVKSLNVE